MSPTPARIEGTVQPTAPAQPWVLTYAHVDVPSVGKQILHAIAAFVTMQKIRATERQSLPLSAHMEEPSTSRGTTQGTLSIVLSVSHDCLLSLVNIQGTLVSKDTAIIH